MRRAILSAVTALVVITLSACGGSGTTPSGPSVTVSPATANVQEGANQQFTATVTGTTSTTVTWQVNGVTGGSSATGLINSSGLYTAPAIIPSPASITITAVLQSNNAISSNSIVTITVVQFSNSSIKGNYVFSLSGVGLSGTPFYLVGTVSADGNGNITAGEADRNSVAAGYTQVPQITGTYSVGSDGRGVLNLNMPALTSQQFTYALAMKALDNAVLNEIDGLAIAATGNFETQSGPLLTPANFAFGFSGVTGCGAINSAGIFNLSSGTLGGVQDVNTCGTITQAQSLSGSYTGVDSLGRGTGNFSGNSGSANFIYYVVTTGSYRFLSPNSATLFLGGANIQVQASFSNTDFSGGYVVSTSANTQSVAGGGVSYTLIQMNASSGNVSSGYYDVNDTGVVGQANLTGAYSLNSNGRISGSFNVNGAGLPFAMYLFSPSLGYYVDERTTAVGGGNIYGQNSAVNTNSAWAGSYATKQFGYFISNAGILPANATAITGQISSNGSGTLAGTLDINDPSPINILTGQTLQGTYNVTNVAPGRATVSISTPNDGPRNYIGYIVDQTRVLLLDVDAGAITAGGDAIRQF
jgi:predicted small lipoprotein YifL